MENHLKLLISSCVVPQTITLIRCLQSWGFKRPLSQSSKRWSFHPDSITGKKTENPDDLQQSSSLFVWDRGSISPINQSILRWRSKTLEITQFDESGSVWESLIMWRMAQEDLFKVQTAETSILNDTNCLNCFPLQPTGINPSWSHVLQGRMRWQRWCGLERRHYSSFRVIRPTKKSPGWSLSFCSSLQWLSVKPL